MLELHIEILLLLLPPPPHHPPERLAFVDHPGLDPTGGTGGTGIPSAKTEK